MKKSFVKNIRCVNCFSGDFIVGGSGEDASELRQGFLTCKACKREYAINKGIVRLMQEPLGPDLHREIMAARKYYENRRKDKTDAWLLSLPLNTKDFGSKVSNNDIWINFKESIGSLKISRNDYVLDLGAGTCWSSTFLAGFSDKVVALDIMEEKYIGLESADVYMRSNGIFFERVAADMFNMPFTDSLFDFVIANASLHHAGNLLRVFKEISRILKKNGKLIAINEPVGSVFSLRQKLSRHKIEHIENSSADVIEGSNENIFSILQWIYFFHKAGLGVVIKPTPYMENILHGKVEYSGSFINMQILDILKRLNFKRYITNKKILYLATLLGCPAYCVGTKQ